MVCQIPLRNRAGDVVDYALVSDGDFDLVSQYKWGRRRTNSKRVNYYVQGSVDGVNRDLHVFLMETAPAGHVWDHQDNDGRHNTRDNLRLATFAQNSQNRPPILGGSSQYIGVSKQKAKWRVNCGGRGFGGFADEADAGKKYDFAALQMYGAHARTNNLLSDTEKKQALETPLPELQVTVIKGYTYVAKSGKYIAKISINNKTVVLGSFSTAAEAQNTYLAKKEQLRREKLAAHLAKPIERLEGTAAIPLHNRKKDVVGYCLVDDEDYHMLTRHGWCLNGGGYVSAMINGSTTLIHRLLKPEWRKIDHRNQNKKDNRKTNLRLIDSSGNGQNKPSAAGSSSKYLGVSKCGDRWRVIIVKDGLRYHVGLFATEMHAAAAYNAKALELYDEPYLNPLPDVIPDAPKKPQADLTYEEVLSRMTSDTMVVESDDQDDIEPSTSNPNISEGSTVGKRRKIATSRFVGVSRYMSGEYVYWAAECRSGETRLRKGGFKSEEEAALEYNKMAEELYDDPKLNVVTPADIPGGLRRRPTTSKYTGVTFDKKVGKWSVSITYKKKTMFIAYFLDEHQGALAYNKKAQELGGRHKLNIVPEGTTLPEEVPVVTEGSGKRKRSNSKSNFVGVTMNGNSWSVLVCVGKTRYRGGTFKNEIDAARKANELIRIHKPNAKLNIIPDETVEAK